MPATKLGSMKRLSEPKTQKCRGCGAAEGDLHDLYCDMERCPFCGDQLSSCHCSHKLFYPNYDPRMTDTFEYVVPFAGLPEDVYNNGLSDEQHDVWLKHLEAKGRVPFIRYPVLCARCGGLWPKFFRVSDEEWEKYIEPRERRQVICWDCYQEIKQLIDQSTKRRN